MSLINQDMNISSLIKTYLQITDIPLLHKIIKYLLSLVAKYENQSNGLNSLSDITKIQSRNNTNDHSSYTTLAINDFVDKDIEDYITNIKSNTITHKRKKRKIYYSRSQTPLMKRNNSFTLQMRENSKRLKEMNSTVQSKVKNYIEKGNLISSYRSKDCSTNNIKLYVKKKVNGTLRKDNSNNNLNKHMTHSVSMSSGIKKTMSKSSSSVSIRKRNNNTSLKSHSKSPIKKKEIVNNGRIIMRDNPVKKHTKKTQKKLRKDFSAGKL